MGLLTGRGLAREKHSQAKVGFQCFSLHLATFFQSFLVRLRDEPDIETVIQVLPHPHLDSRDLRELVRYLVDFLGFPPGSVRLFRQSVWESFDVVIYTDVFARFSLGSRRNVLLNHGIGTSRRFTRRGFYRRYAYDFDEVFCASSLDQQSLLARQPAGNNTRILRSGSVIFDRLASPPVDRTHYLTSLGLDPSQRTILFAPHFTRLRSPTYDTVRRTRLTLDLLATLHANVIVKLHDMSYYKHANGGYDWDETMTRWQREGLRVDRDRDDVPALLYSDVIVTDVSSRGLIFVALGKSCILYLDGIVDGPGTEPTPLEPESHALLRDVSSTATSLEELRRLVARALAQPRTVDRSAMLDRAGIRPAGSPTEGILAHLRRSCSLPPPSDPRVSEDYG
jgi:hypothetical protein